MKYTNGIRARLMHGATTNPQQCDDILAAVRHIEELKSLLRQCEWVDPIELGYTQCPACKAKVSGGHKPGCKLAAAINAEGV